MILAWLDLLILGVFFLVTVMLAFKGKELAHEGMQGFFLGGRNMPWYLAGLSMVATTFAADTPLAVTEIVASGGIAGNWIWWSFLAGGMFTTFFFARYWRRSGVTTEVELISLRYGGKPARFLRIFKALYLGLVMNVLVMAWVNLAMLSLLDTFLPVNFSSALSSWLPGSISPSLFVLFVLLLVVALLSAMAGLKGIAMMDAFQFSLAMIGCIALAWMVIESDQIGGIAALRDKIPAGSLNFFPSFSPENTVNQVGIGIGAFFAYAGVMWWSSWYPGQEPGGGGYVAQRMMGTKSERDSVLATLLFQITHYIVRPWPWILVALAALVLYPELGPDEKRLGYALAIRDFLPPGLKGLMLAAFLGAYMSTISTQLNWGASYLINDALIPLKDKKRSAGEWDKKQVLFLSRMATLMLMVLSAWASTQISSIKSVWEFIIECGAGLGMVLMLRWYWWRINVWSEISATLTPFMVYALAKFVFDLTFPESFFLTVGITTLVWVLVTFLTPPEKPEVLKNFVARVKPAGYWKEYHPTLLNNPLQWQLFAWLGAVGTGYSGLFLVGYLLLQFWMPALYCLITLLISLGILRISIQKGDLLQSD